MRGGNINDLKVSLFSDDVFLPESYFDAEKQVKLNDVVIVASTGSKAVIGKAGYIDRDIPNTQIGAFLRLVRPIDISLASYIRLLFATEYYREHIRTQSQGTNIACSTIFSAFKTSADFSLFCNIFSISFSLILYNKKGGHGFNFHATFGCSIFK